MALTLMQPEDLAEQLGQAARAKRATRRRDERRALDQEAHDAYCAEQSEEAHGHAACAWDRAVAARGLGNRGRFDDAMADFRRHRATADWWEARIGQCHDERKPVVIERRDASGELPDPEPIDFENLARHTQRRLVNLVSDARNWAYEPLDEMRLVPSMIKYETRPNGERYVVAITEPKVRPVRSKPGHHIIGGADDLVTGRQAVITVWSTASQQWVLYQAHMGEPLNGFTQWLPTAYIRVPRPPESIERDAWVDRASLDDHSDRCVETLAQALDWAYEWAQQLRAEQAAPSVEDVLARGDWTSFEWASSVS